jgi:YesN/AraC family two-component response regulator
VETASSGEQALKYLRKYQPDLLITDICMMGMNGLDLIEEAQKQYPEMKFLIISAYHEFDYARRALTSGVTDYILKTEITTAALTQKLTEIKASFHRETGDQDALRSIDLEAFFQKKETMLSEYPHLLDIQKQLYYFVVIGSARMFSRNVNESFENPSERINLAMESFGRIAREHCARPVFCLWNNNIILGVSEDIADGRHWQPLSELLAHMRFIIPSSSMPYILFYQEEKMTLEKFKASIQYLEPVLLYHLLFYPDKPVSLNTLEKQHYITVNHSFSFHSLIFDEEHEEADLLMIKDYIQDCCKNYDVCSIILFYRKFCTHMEISSNNRIQLPMTLHAQAPEHFLKWCFNTLHQCISGLFDGDSVSCSPAVEAAIQYIKQNYSDLELSSVKIASAVGLSSNRLGVLFKQDTGNTINEYLNQYRIKKAVELLEKTNMKIYEISEKCGYKSSQYFSQVIYQKTGKHPIDYRKASRS